MKRDPEKLRAWQRRSAPLRSVAMERQAFNGRRKRVNPVNRERKKKLYEKNFGERAEWIRTLPCRVRVRNPGCCSCSGRIVAAHVKSRGAGGDRTSLVPLCWGHHEEQGTMGIQSFCKKYEFDMEEDAAKLDALAQGLEIP